jgi:hypothetical protein
MGRFRAGMLVGFAAGYVMGSKAGRERYEQINRAWRRIKATEGYQTASGKVGAAVGLGIERSKVVALDGLHKATGNLKRKRESDW